MKPSAPDAPLNLTQSIIIIVIGALILLPVLFNTVAALPVKDDACFFLYIDRNSFYPPCAIAEQPPQWAQGSRIMSFIAARYIGWSGRFTSDLLIASWLTLPIDLMSGYVPMLYILFVIQCVAIYLFFRMLSSLPRIAIALTVSAMALSSLFTPQINESEYWITAILTYKMAVIGFALFCMYVRRLFGRIHTTLSGNRSISRLRTGGHVLAVTIGAALLCGFNESFALVMLLLATALVLCTHKRTNRMLAITVLIGVAIGIALVIGAPGNSSRLGSDQSELATNIPFTLLVTLALELCYGAIFTVLIFILHFLRPFRAIMQSVRQYNSSLFSMPTSYPYIIICSAYFLIPAAIMLPLAWGLGNIGPLRAHGQIILMMLLLLPIAYNAMSVLIVRGTVPFLNRGMSAARTYAGTHTTIATIFRCAVAVSLCALAVFGMPLIGQPSEVIPGPEFFSQVTEYELNTAQIMNLAITKYFRGNLYHGYGDMLTRTIPHVREIRHRQTHISAAAARGIDVISVPPFTAPPKTVFIGDIDTYPSNYNRTYAVLYGGQQIILQQ